LIARTSQIMKTPMRPGQPEPCEITNTTISLEGKDDSAVKRLGGIVAILEVYGSALFCTRSYHLASEARGWMRQAKKVHSTRSHQHLANPLLDQNIGNGRSHTMRTFLLMLSPIHHGWPSSFEVDAAPALAVPGTNIVFCGVRNTAKNLGPADSGHC
jgi:hypothetical protein